MLLPRTRGVSANHKPGAGLGLNIAGNVISAHGGRVHIGDAPEGGALVTLELPVLGAYPLHSVPGGELAA